MTTYLEDLREGSEYLSAARTIGKEDITAFAGLSGDFSPLHTPTTNGCGRTRPSPAGSPMAP
jgi:acyl dehydratase